jgi:hypothetical protein
VSNSPDRQEHQQQPAERLAKVVPIRPGVPPHISAELARLKAEWRSKRPPWQEQPATSEAEQVRQRALRRKYEEA